MGTNDDEALRRRLDAGTQRTGKDLPCSAPPRLRVQQNERQRRRGPLDGVRGASDTSRKRDQQIPQDDGASTPGTCLSSDMVESYLNRFAAPVPS
jgi:hypothetical protein